jgi:hypothetical protein
MAFPITVKDVLELLDRIPVWRAMKELPDRVEALEARLCDLEAKLAKAPGEACPFCGDRAFRIERLGRMMGGGKEARA